MYLNGASMKTSTQLTTLENNIFSTYVGVIPFFTIFSAETIDRIPCFNGLKQAFVMTDILSLPYDVFLVVTGQCC